MRDSADVSTMRLLKWLPALAVVAAATACSSSSSPVSIPNTPVPATLHAAAAPESVATYLLHPGDFGSGWYPGTTPAFTVVPSPVGGASSEIVTMFGHMHKVTVGWALDDQVIEKRLRFTSIAAARHYVHTLASPPAGSISAPAVTTFRNGAVVYVLNIDSHPLAGSPSKAEIVRAAKDRSATGQPPVGS